MCYVEKYYCSGLLCLFRQVFLFHIKGLCRKFTGNFLMPELWLTILWFCFTSWIDWKSWNDPLKHVFYTCCILCVIIGQNCNLLFSSCKWIFNYTYITVCKSMGKLLCNSLWNWSWGNAYIHSCWRFIMNYLYLNTLSSISVLFMKLTFSILVCHIPWYIPCVLQNMTILTGNRSICCSGISAKILQYFVSRIGYTCLIWSDLCMFVNMNKKFSVRLECNENS